ncbi:MAG: polysaccharide deacetylase [Caldisericales bacterium]|nr:polysaccharide deacetylase [Caldisericales bacterium]
MKKKTARRLRRIVALSLFVCACILLVISGKLLLFPSVKEEPPKRIEVFDRYWLRLQEKIDWLAKQRESKSAKDFLWLSKRTLDLRPLSSKTVFLTFDDGPSGTTPRILDVLKANGVKATFFTLGLQVDDMPSIVRRTLKEGHCVLSHGYSHRYDLYNDPPKFFEDIDRSMASIMKATSEKPPSYVRLPGGANNQYPRKKPFDECKKGLLNRGISYVEWNASMDDSTFRKHTKNYMIENVLLKAKANSFIVVLMHDSAGKGLTASALPEVIKGLKDMGFVFRTFSNLSDAEKKRMLSLKLINR